MTPSFSFERRRGGVPPPLKKKNRCPGLYYRAVCTRRATAQMGRDEGTERVETERTLCLISERAGTVRNNTYQDLKNLRLLR